jgi:excisionase family DNA binding protein
MTLQKNEKTLVLKYKQKLYLPLFPLKPLIQREFFVLSKSSIFIPNTITLNKEHGMNEKSQFLNRVEAAKYLNLKKHTLEAWAVRGGGPAFVKFGRAVRYRMVDLNEYVES